MDYTFALRLTPKPQRLQKRNTSPEQWKKICEEREKLMTKRKNKELEEIEIINYDETRTNTCYAEDKDDWEDIEKWELEKNEKPLVIKSETLNKNINNSSGTVPISNQISSCVSSSDNIAEHPVGENMDPINDRMETFTIDETGTTF